MTLSACNIFHMIYNKSRALESIHYAILGTKYPSEVDASGKNEKMTATTRKLLRVIV